MQLPAGKPAELLQTRPDFKGKQHLAAVVGPGRETGRVAPASRRFRGRTGAFAAFRPWPEALLWRSRLRGAALALCGESGQVACRPCKFPVCTVIPYTSSLSVVEEQSRRRIRPGGRCRISALTFG